MRRAWIIIAVVIAVRGSYLGRAGVFIGSIFGAQRSGLVGAADDHGGMDPLFADRLLDRRAVGVHT
jgi:hypothetical protein